MAYSISAFSQLTNLSIHTLRYYEQIGLITPQRNNGNQQIYSQQDLAWVEFIKRLKETNMPIKEIQHYAQLRAAGSSTLEARLALLIGHRQHLMAQLQTLQTHQLKLDEKISFYQKAIKQNKSAV